MLSIWLASVLTNPTVALYCVRLSTTADVAVSSGSTPSATEPNLPYELLPFVARTLPPDSAKYPMCE